MDLDIERLQERLILLEEQIRALQLGITPSGGGWENSAEPCVDQAQIIDAEAATAGVATTPPRSDGKMGLSLVGDPGDVEAAAEPKQTLGFWKLLTVGTRWGLGIIFGTHPSPPSTAGHLPSLEATEDAGGVEGARVKISPYYDGTYAHLAVASDGVRVPLDPAGAIVNTTAGPKVNKGNGIDIDGSNLLVVKPDTSGLAVSVSASGVKVAAPKLDDCAAPDDNTDLNASTSAHGLLLKATAPGAGLRNVVAIDNGETAYKNAALFDATNPADLGSAAPGSAMTAARRDHVHNAPSASVTVEKSTLSGDVSLTGATWTDILTITCPAGGDCLVWASAFYDGTAIWTRLLDDGASVADCAPTSMCASGLFAIMAAGSTAKLQGFDSGAGKKALSGLCFIAALKT